MKQKKDKKTSTAVCRLECKLTKFHFAHIGHNCEQFRATCTCTCTGTGTHTRTAQAIKCDDTFNKTALVLKWVQFKCIFISSVQEYEMTKKRRNDEVSEKKTDSLGLAAQILNVIPKMAIGGRKKKDKKNILKMIYHPTI